MTSTLIVNSKAVAQGMSDNPKRNIEEPTILHIYYEDGGCEGFSCVSPQSAVDSLRAMRAFVEKHNRPRIVHWKMQSVETDK